MPHLPQPVRSGGFSPSRVVRRACVHRTVTPASRAKFERELADQARAGEPETHAGEVRES